MISPIEEMEEFIVINRLKSIESEVLRIKIVESPEEVEGKVIESIKTIPLDEVNYIVTKTTDGCIFCASYAKCGDGFVMNSIPYFDLKEIATEEVDFGYTTHAYHIFELYSEMGLIIDEDHEYLKLNFNVLKNKVEIDVKKSRLIFSIKEAVKLENFTEAEKLKNRLDELK